MKVVKKNDKVTLECGSSHYTGYIIEVTKDEYRIDDKWAGEIEIPKNEVVEIYIDQRAELLGYASEFTYITTVMTEPERTLKLSAIMDKMCAEFKIPLLNDEAYNIENLDIIFLYRQISNARDFGDGDENLIKETFIKYCAECHRDFVPGEIVHYTWMENNYFCDKCKELMNDRSDPPYLDWQRRKVK